MPALQQSPLFFTGGLLSPPRARIHQRPTT
jgi:hypothetical protein